MASKTKPNVEKALSQFMEIATTEVFKMGVLFQCGIANDLENTDEIKCFASKQGVKQSETPTGFKLVAFEFSVAKRRKVLF